MWNFSAVVNDTDRIKGAGVCRVNGVDHAGTRHRALLWLYESVLRGDGEAVGGPGQLKAQLASRVVPDVNVPRRGHTVCKKERNRPTINSNTPKKPVRATVTKYGSPTVKATLRPSGDV